MTAQVEIEAFFHADSETFSYLAADPASGEAALIDPVLDYEPRAGRTGTASAVSILERAQQRGWSIRLLLETHAHADHLSAGDWLRRQLPGSRLAIGRGITGVQRHFAPLFGLDGFNCDGSQFDRLFDDDERFSLGALEGRAIATPGHTPDSMSYLIGDALFVGDSIFMPDGGSARCDFPGGDAATLYRSIHRLYALPDATRVLVCHDYCPGGRERRHQTTIGAQRRENIHLHEGIDEASFVALRQARDATLPVPALLLPALQVNIRGGVLPAPAVNGIRYLQIPLDQL
jgi:glyoxylase-like metal-dependent hydrolase (beta-lactamase superfamily II)